jgi:hypothetical protein
MKASSHDGDPVYPVDPVAADLTWGEDGIEQR